MRTTKNFTARVGAFLTAFVCLIAIFPVRAAAQTAGGFSIRAVLPENQADKKQTYFDLRMSPGQEQTVEVVITNSRSEPLDAVIALNPASTGRNGLILYAADEETQGVNIRDLATLSQHAVTVPAEGSYTVEIDLKMPSEPMDGVVLGGIAVSETPEANADTAAQGVSITNAITYVVALKLTQQDEPPAPDFSLVSVGPALTDYRPTVVARLRNLSPRIIKDMKINAAVYKGSGTTPLHTLALNSADMAPTSDGDFVIDWNNEPLGQGRYRLKMTATYEGKTWEWDEGFDIGSEAGDINENAVSLKRNYTWLYVSGGVVLLILVWFIAYRRGKKERRA